MSELKDMAIITPGQKITYITDISPTNNNIEKAVALARDSHVLYIEAVFPKENDKERWPEITSLRDWLV
ncbi:hypothetical protein OMAG_002574 [Candidatus Omnitrophus magneticus]|uniref:Uncharacterized protein n=1 Tax=Candidatus Omnitrophus magneticus TaxID=1609969 RepID=A0A0F0CQ59_9BACT|nr:hypothetical protein OMAG_002574 [Candidatus Omnitrophus magneticus]